MLAQSKNILSIVICLLSAVILLSLFFFSRYGIDLTDEGLYLAWMADPFLNGTPTTQFAFIYHPVYALLEGDIAALRQVNILITFILAWIFCHQLIKSLALSVGFASIAMLLFYTGLYTPNYNSLALNGLLLTAIGLVWLRQQGNNAQSIVASLFIGSGGWLCFMAKPTTAALLGSVVVMYLLMTKKMHSRVFLIAIFTALTLLLLSALLIDGSTLDYINRIISGVKFVQYQNGGYSFSEIFRIDKIRFRKDFRGLFITLVPLTLLAINMYFHCIRRVPSLSRPQWGLGLCLIVFPYVYAFGTNNNYWANGSFAGIFWVMGSLILLEPLFEGKIMKTDVTLFSSCIASQIITFALLIAAFEAPYRQPQPLWQNDKMIEVGRSGSNLILSQGFGSYIEKAQTAATSAGFISGSPLIDLTGRSPGLLYALQARNTGLAWMIGGYPGSNKLASEALKKASCEEIAHAWILLEPQEKRHLSSEILVNVGANIMDYEEVASWKTAKGVGGSRQENHQYLMKPKRAPEIATQACLDNNISE